MGKRFNGSLAAIFMLAWVAARPGAALAQGNTWAGESLARMVEKARWRLDVLRINASLDLTNVGYDTDIYYGYFGEAVPDLTMITTVPIQILLPISKKAVLELAETPQYLFYGKTERERAWNNSFNGRFHLALDKVYIQAGGGSSNVRQRLSPELDVNVRQKTDSLDGIILWQTSREFSLAVLYAYSRYDYGSAEFSGYDPAETLNRNESFADFVTYLQMGTKVRLFLDAQYGKYAFREAPSKDRNAQSYGAFGGLEFIPPEGEVGHVAPPRGMVSLGYQYFDILDPAHRDGSGFVGAVNVSAGLFAKTEARAFFMRGFAFSVYSDESFYLSTVFGAGLSRRLTRRSTFSYDASFGRSKNPTTTGETPAPDRAFRFTNHAFVVGIQLTRYLGVSFLAQLGRRSLGEAGSPKARDFFGLSLTYGVPAGSISKPVRGLSR